MKTLTKIKNWFWFNYIIKKDEFHPSLDCDFKKLLKGDKVREKEQMRVIRQRQLAHEMDMKEN